MSITTKVLGCNISCIYCNQEGFCDRSSVPKLSYDIDAMLETLKSIDDSEGRGNPDPHAKGGDICLHGGEPTLMRIEDMERFLIEVRKTNPHRHISLQTNAYALSDEHLRLFKEYNIGIGVSIDGPDELNGGRGFYSSDGVRREEISNKYTEKVEENIQRLINAHIQLGFIVVLNKFNSSTKEKRTRLKQWLLDWFSKGVNSSRLNLAYVDNSISKPVVELSSDEAAEAHVDYCLWALDHPEAVLLPFRSLVDNLLGLKLEECRFAACDPYRTGGENVIMPNGGRGNCWRLVGKIGEEKFWTRDSNTSNIRQVVLNSIPYNDGGCGGCRYVKLCNGGCPGESVDGDWRNKSRFCKAYYETYAVVENRLKALLPNILLVSDFKGNEVDFEDNRKRSSGHWDHFAFDSMWYEFTKFPSSYAKAASKEPDCRSAKPKLKLLDVSPVRFSNAHQTTGIMSYRDDFLKLVVPELKKYFDFTIFDKADITLSLFTSCTESDRSSSRSFMVEHANQNLPLWLEKNGGEAVLKNQTFITHCMRTKLSLESFGASAVYMPMGIDIDSVPKTLHKNGRWIYFANLQEEEKIRVFDDIKKAIPNIDFISFNKFNGTGDRLSRNEILSIVSQYSYGIGVGRSLLEMLAMGLKCIVAGSEYGGPITSADEFKHHHLMNCNGMFKNSMGSIEEDAKVIVEKGILIPTNLFDMKLLISQYFEILGVTQCD